jgi:hypothetical protein
MQDHGVQVFCIQFSNNSVYRVLSKIKCRKSQKKRFNADVFTSIFTKNQADK